jgi:hypothetical protein
MEEIKMNYQWKSLAERGQPAFGFVDVFKLTGRGTAVVIIKYLAQHTDPQQRIVLTVLLEGKRGQWTDGMIDGINEDVENRIRVLELVKFTKFNTLDHLEAYYFYIQSLEGLDYISHGDLGFID